MEELKRCPFCGNEQGNGMGIRTGTNYVYCQCGVLKPSHGWNSRREEDKLNKIIARMRNEITGMEVALNYYQNRRLEAVARIVELEDANLKLRDELNAIEIITDARFEYRNGELSTSEMVLDTFARLDKAHAELVELEDTYRWIPVSESLPEKNGIYSVLRIGITPYFGKHLVESEIYFSVVEPSIWINTLKVIFWRENLPLPEEKE